MWLGCSACRRCGLCGPLGVALLAAVCWIYLSLRNGLRPTLEWAMGLHVAAVLAFRVNEAVVGLLERACGACGVTTTASADDDEQRPPSTAGAAAHWRLRMVVSLATGVALAVACNSNVLFGGVPSDAWVVARHNVDRLITIDGATGSNTNSGADSVADVSAAEATAAAAPDATSRLRPLAGLNVSAFVVSMGEGPYVGPLLHDLHRYGLPTSAVHVVDALDSATCRVERHHPPTRGVWTWAEQLFRQVVLAERCFDRCWFRCHSNGELCPPEASPDFYHTVVCEDEPSGAGKHSRGSGSGSAGDAAGGGVGQSRQSGHGDHHSGTRHHNNGDDSEISSPRRSLAATPAAPPRVTLINVSDTFMDRSTALRELAVATSHLRAVHAAYRSGAEVALVLEDDASLALAPEWRQMGVAQVLQALPPNWNVVQLHVWLGLSFGGAARVAELMKQRLLQGELVRRGMSLIAVVVVVVAAAAAAAMVVVWSWWWSWWWWWWWWCRRCCCRCCRCLVAVVAPAAAAWREAFYEGGSGGSVVLAPGLTV
jgi:hypothetical protein